MSGMVGKDLLCLVSISTMAWAFYESQKSLNYLVLSEVRSALSLQIVRFYLSTVSIFNYLSNNIG